MPLRILSLCDKTGTMVRPWLEAGHEAVIVDLQHPPGVRTEGPLTRVGADLSRWEPEPRFDVAFGFPPCTDLAVSGALHWARKGEDAYRRAVAFALRIEALIAMSGARCWAIENPRGRLTGAWRPWDYDFDPAEYGGYLGDGDRYTKRTCLWTGPDFVMPTKQPLNPSEGSKMHRLPPGPERQNLRSATPEGFARAVFAANEPHLTGQAPRGFVTPRQFTLL